MLMINLLPWREKKRQAANKRYKAHIGLGMLIAALIVLLIRQAIVEMNEQQGRINAMLTSEIGQLDQQVAEVAILRAEQDAVRERIRIIENLQQDRATVVRILDELVISMPIEILLRSVRREEQFLFIEGLSVSYSGITELMRRLEASALFASAILNDITTETSAVAEDAFAFSLSVELNYGARFSYENVELEAE